MLADRVKGGDGAESAEINDGGAELNWGDHHGGHAEAVEQRDDAEEAVIMFECGMLNGGIDIGLEVAVGEHDAFWRAAGSAGVHEDGEVVGAVRWNFWCDGRRRLGKFCEVDDIQPGVGQSAKRAGVR